MESNAAEVTRTANRPRIIRGFVFKSVFGDDPELCRELIEVSLNMRVKSVEVVQPEREIDVHVDRRAGRLDLFVVDNDGRHYDIEVQAQRRHNEWLRARHYQALMDVSQLRKGTEVNKLRDSIVVFVCDFDPVGAGWRVYDCRTVCLQTGEAVADGRRLVLLNAHGTMGEVSSSLDAFLRFVGGEDVQGDPFVDRLNAIIDEKVADREWMENYMDYYDELEAEKEAARRDGRAEGLVEAAAKMVREGVMDEGTAAGLLGITVDDIRRALAEV